MVTSRVRVIRDRALRRSARVAFDLDTYKRIAAPVALDDVDFGAFRTKPLGPDPLRCLRFTRRRAPHLVLPPQPPGRLQGHAGPRETALLITTLFGDDAGRHVAARIDRRIDRLPGLTGLGLMDRALADRAA